MGPAGGKALLLIQRTAPLALVGQQQPRETLPQRDVAELGARQPGDTGQRHYLAITLVDRRQLARRAVGSREHRIELEVRSVQSIACTQQIGRHYALKARLQRREFGTPVQYPQPLIAAREHVGQQVFELVPVVVEVHKQMGKRLAPHRAIGNAGHGFSRRFTIELRGILFDPLRAGQARADRRLTHDVLTQGVDGHDAQARGLGAQVPTERMVMGQHSTGVSVGRSAEGIVRQRLAGEIERGDNARTHFLGGFTREGDGQHLFGLAHGSQ